MDFKIAVNDVYGNEAYVSISIFSILKEGALFKEQGCVLPIFNNNLRDQFQFNIGQVFFDQNYVVFDASPSFKQGTYFNQILFGKSQQNGLVLEKQPEVPVKNETTSEE